MESFTYPSDRDRAENEELDRVCEYLENVEEQLEAITHYARFITKSYNDLNKLRHTMMQLDPAEIPNYLVMKWPVIQGTRNQFNIEQIGEQAYESKAVSNGVFVLLGE